jgi:Ca2+-binding EF-hand superfamily protein
LSGLFDADHDGVISAAEISAACVALGRLDLNHDGQITREELPPPPHPPKQSEGKKDDSGPPPPEPPGEAP